MVIYMFYGFITVIGIVFVFCMMVMGVDSFFKIAYSCHVIEEYLIQMAKILFVILFFSFLIGGCMYLEDKNKTEVVVNDV